MLSKLLTRQTLQSIVKCNTNTKTSKTNQIVINFRSFSKTPQMNRIENVLIIGSGLMGSGIQELSFVFKNDFKLIVFIFCVLCKASLSRVRRQTNSIQSLYRTSLTNSCLKPGLGSLRVSQI